MTHKQVIMTYLWFSNWFHSRESFRSELRANRCNYLNLRSMWEFPSSICSALLRIKAWEKTSRASRFRFITVQRLFKWLVILISFSICQPYTLNYSALLTSSLARGQEEGEENEFRWAQKIISLLRQAEKKTVHWRRKRWQVISASSTSTPMTRNHNNFPPIHCKRARKKRKMINDDFYAVYIKYITI